MQKASNLPYPVGYASCAIVIAGADGVLVATGRELGAALDRAWLPVIQKAVSQMQIFPLMVITDIIRVVDLYAR